MTRTLVRKVAHDEADAALQVAADRVDGVVEVTGRSVGAESPAAGLYDVAVETAARMLTVGSTHHGHVGRVVLGEVTDNLVNGAPCAVAVAPHDVEVRALRRIGAAFEDSAEGHAALREAIAVAAGTDARIEVWTVVGEGDDAQERKRLAEAALTEALAQAGADAEPHVEVGDAGAVLARASADLDALVCGSRGYGPLNAVLLGSVTRSLARQAQCALIIVPHTVSSR